MWWLTYKAVYGQVLNFHRLICRSRAVSIVVQSSVKSFCWYLCQRSGSGSDRKKEYYIFEGCEDQGVQLFIAFTSQYTAGKIIWEMWFSRGSKEHRVVAHNAVL